MPLSHPPLPSRRRAHALRTLVVLGVVAGCGAPDRPAGVAGPLPAEALEWLAPDSVRAARVAPGVVHRYLWSPRGPWAVHLVEVDLDRCDLGFEVVAAPADAGRRGGRATVTSMVAAHPRRVVAAVNGDFFTPEGMPVGPEVAGGEIRTRRTRDALVVQGGRDPFFGRSGVSRDAEAHDLAEGAGWAIDEVGVGAVHMVGGFPELLDGGVRVGDLGVSENPAFAASRHPRTAVGWDGAARRFWIVVVDGRQGAYSTGMTLPEVAALFESLGARDALNLDGGGSSVLVLDGRSVNRPSDPTGERPVVNALMLVDDDGFCPVAPSARPPEQVSADRPPA